MVKHEGTNLVKTKYIDSSTKVDSRRTDTEDPPFLQPTLGINGTNSHGSWQGRGDNYGDDVQHSKHCSLCWFL